MRAGFDVNGVERLAVGLRIPAPEKRGAVTQKAGAGDAQPEQNGDGYRGRGTEAHNPASRDDRLSSPVRNFKRVRRQQRQERVARVLFRFLGGGRIMKKKLREALFGAARG